MTRRVDMTTGRRERGSVLILVLVFMSAVGLVTIALLKQTDTNFRFGRVAKAEQARNYAAQAGIDAAIDRMHQAGGCDSTPSLTGLPVVNTRTPSVTIECLALSQISSAAAPWSVFITGTTGTTPGFTTIGGSTTIDGPFYNGLPGPSAWGNQLDLTVTGGDVQQVQIPGTGCSTQPSNLDVDTAAGYGYYGCLDPLPTPTYTSDLPSGLVAAPAPVTNGAGTCRVFFPGIYQGNLPALLEGPGTVNYFASGVYFLDGMGNIVLNPSAGSVINVLGGKPHLTQQTQLGLSCSASQYASDPANGVLFVLGGTSKIRANSNVNMELFGWTAPSGIELSLYQATTTLDATAPAPFAGVASNPQGGETLRVSSGGSGSDVVIHGLVYSPGASVDASGSDSFGRVELRGGVVADQLTIKRTATVALGLPAGYRSTAIVTSTAVPISGEGGQPVTATAVVHIGGTSDSPVIASWRLS